jgi:hypothetical protein
MVAARDPRSASWARNAATAAARNGNRRPQSPPGRPRRRAESSPAPILARRPTSGVIGSQLKIVATLPGQIPEASTSAMVSSATRFCSSLTELVPVGAFWEAESEHQDYLERYPEGYNCHFVRPGWELPRRAEAKAS